MLTRRNSSPSTIHSRAASNATSRTIVAATIHRRRVSPRGGGPTIVCVRPRLLAALPSPARGGAATTVFVGESPALTASLQDDGGQLVTEYKIDRSAQAQRGPQIVQLNRLAEEP